MGVQVLPLAAQWVNSPEFNPAQGHATMDMDQYLIMRKASLWMCFSGLAVESSGVYGRHPHRRQPAAPRCRFCALSG